MNKELINNRETQGYYLQHIDLVYTICCHVLPKPDAVAMVEEIYTQALENNPPTDLLGARRNLLHQTVESLCLRQAFNQIRGLDLDGVPYEIEDSNSYDLHSGHILSLTVLILKVAYDFSYKEIGEIFDLTKGEVIFHIQEMKKAMVKEMFVEEETIVNTLNRIAV